MDTLTTSGKEKDEHFNQNTKNPEPTPLVRSAVTVNHLSNILCRGKTQPTSVSRVRVEILRSKILPDLDSDNNRTMRQGQGAVFFLALDYRDGKAGGQ